MESVWIGLALSFKGLHNIELDPNPVLINIAKAPCCLFVGEQNDMKSY